MSWGNDAPPLCDLRVPARESAALPGGRPTARAQAGSGQRWQWRLEGRADGAGCQGTCSVRGRRPSPSQACKARQRRGGAHARRRSEEHTSELQSLMRISYAVFCLKNKTEYKYKNTKLQISTKLL